MAVVDDGWGAIGAKLELQEMGRWQREDSLRIDSTGLG